MGTRETNADDWVHAVFACVICCALQISVAALVLPPPIQSSVLLHAPVCLGCRCENVAAWTLLIHIYLCLKLSKVRVFDCTVPSITAFSDISSLSSSAWNQRCKNDHLSPLRAFFFLSFWGFGAKWDHRAWDSFEHTLNFTARHQLDAIPSIRHMYCILPKSSLFYDFRCLCYLFILVHVRDHAGSCQSNAISKDIKKSKGWIKFLHE